MNESFVSYTRLLVEVQKMTGRLLRGFWYSTHDRPTDMGLGFKRVDVSIYHMFCYVVCSVAV